MTTVEELTEQRDELLEALEATLRALGWFLDYITFDDNYVQRYWEQAYDPKDAVKMAHNAINKAKGEVASDG